jgi:hypothetical protein
MRKLLGVFVLLITVTEADANWLRGNKPAVGTVPGAAGMRSWAGVPGVGGAVPPSHTKPGTSPVIGSAVRTGHFTNPITGRTRFTESVFDPTTGRFSKEHFRR